jgi:hypothetical protein
LIDRPTWRGARWLSAISAVAGEHGAFIASSGLGLLIEVAKASDVCGPLHLVGVV